MGDMSDPCECPTAELPGISTWITRATWIYADFWIYSDLKHGNARSPGAAQSTPLSCQFCATQCNLRCNAACQTRTECSSAGRTQAPVRVAKPRRSRFLVRAKPLPLRGEA